MDMHDICITSTLHYTQDSAPNDSFHLDEVNGVNVEIKLSEGNKCEYVLEKYLQDVSKCQNLYAQGVLRLLVSRAIGMTRIGLNIAFLN